MQFESTLRRRRKSDNNCSKRAWCGTKIPQVLQYIKLVVPRLETEKVLITHPCECQIPNYTLVAHDWSFHILRGQTINPNWKVIPEVVKVNTATENRDDLATPRTKSTECSVTPQKSIAPHVFQLIKRITSLYSPAKAFTYVNQQF